MRREQKKNNRLTIIIILAGFATLLSFFFDQQVIQSEDNIRKIKYNLNQKRIKILNLQSTINGINSLNFDISESVNFYKNSLDFFYLYGGIANTQVYGNQDEKLEFYNQDKEILISYKKSLKENVLIALKSYDDKIEQFRILNNQILSNPFVSEILTNNEGYEIMQSNFDKYKAKNKFSDFPFDYYLSDSDLKKLSEEQFALQDHYVVMSKVRDLMSELHNIDDEYWDLLQRMNIKYDNAFIFFSDYLEYFGTQKNKKNLFILLSIFFQILSLTILLILFREMIKSKV